MNAPTIDVRLARILSWLIAIIFVLLPFHAFLTVWLSSLVGHYTLLRLWKEFLLVLVVAGAVYILSKDSTLRRRFMRLKLVWLIAAYMLLMFAWGFVPLIRHDVSTKAVWYGLLVDLRFPAFFLAVMVVAAKSDWLKTRWLKILLGPATLVAAFAVLQYLVLPYDFLKHLGYGVQTISPYETINHNIHHIRVMSTLRGANPLGAYLIIPITVLGVMFFREKAQKLNKSMLSVGLLLALLFSFSRSAWLGALLSLIAVTSLSLRSQRAKRLAGGTLAALIILCGIVALLLRNNLNFQNAVFHTDQTSKIATSSNENHLSAFRSAADDIARQPFGEGVGTAGPQSVYNKLAFGRIAENYFLQIGQEAGVLAMLLFIAICIYVGVLLFNGRSDPLALALLASLIGISFVNLLSHAWTDDTLAYLWWGLAALALTPAILDLRHKQDGKVAKTANKARSPVRRIPG